MMILNKLFSIGLRTFPMLLKMLLLFFLGNYSLEAVGQYGILIATLTILSTFFGLETYNITLKIFVTDVTRFKQTFLGYFILSTITFLITLFLFFLFSFDKSDKLTLYTSILLIAYVEYILNEYYKLSVVSKPEIYVNIFYFIKNGIWPISFMGTYYITSTLKYAFWIYAVTQLLILFFVILLNFKSIRSFRLSGLRTIDFSFFYYLIRAVTLRINQYLDRFSVSYFLDDTVTGIIVLMTSLSSFIGQIGDAIVVPSYFRKILAGVTISSVRLYQVKMLKTGLSWMIIPLVTFYLYNLYNDSELNDLIIEMFIICIVSVINLTAIPFHQSLLSMKAHKKILTISIVNLLLSIIVLNLVLYISSSIFYLNLSILLISILIYFVKERFFIKQLYTSG